MINKNSLDDVNIFLSRYFDLLDFSLYRNGYWYNLELSLEADSQKIDILFENVGRLSINNFGGGLVQLKIISIVDITEYQNDGVSYEVRTIDDDNLYFVCQSYKLGPKVL